MVTPGIKDKLKHSFARATRQKGLLQRATSYYKLFLQRVAYKFPLSDIILFLLDYE